jgi:hypothetical protein
MRETFGAMSTRTSRSATKMISFVEAAPNIFALVASYSILGASIRDK